MSDKHTDNRDDPADGTAVDEIPVDLQRQGTPERQRTKRVRRAEPDDLLIDTRFDDDEFVVTADIPGASKDDLSVGINPRTNTLAIGVDELVLERVPLPWKSAEATKVWLNNGVLEVRLRSDNP